MLSLIKKWEGCKLKAYQDGGGVWTIGYGTTFYPQDGSKVKEGDTCTQGQADNWLQIHVNNLVFEILHLVKPTLNENQLGALVCFVYNIGIDAFKLSHDYEKRIKFQADMSDYVDMAISSTINLPAWGTKDNNESKVSHFASVLSKYAPRLRGLTVYPDGSRGGQPLTEVSYEEAMKHRGVVFEENDICIIGGKGGTCGS